MIAAWKSIGGAGLDLLFPPLCLACRAPVGSEGGFCAECWGQLTFLDGPACACCGTPFPADPGPGSLCAACLAQSPAFTKARAILAYDEASLGAILALKHADRLELVPGFARWLGRVGRPLHPVRLWLRRYNQSAELGRRGAV